MRVKSISCKNAKGFENFEMDCGDVNLITGRNGLGKSSVIDILCAAFSVDGDRRLLKEGSTEGEIKVVLEDDSETWEVRRKLEPGKVSQPKVKGSKSGPKGAPAAWLKSIVDVAAMDPLRTVMGASPKEKSRILLETMPLEMAEGAVEKAVSDAIKLPQTVLKAIAKAEPLDAIKLAYDHIYEERTGVGSIAEDKECTARELGENIRNQVNLGSDDDLPGMRVTYANLTKELARIQNVCESALAEEKTAIKDRHVSHVAFLRSEAQKKIDAIQSDLSKQIEESSIETADEIEAITAEAADKLKQASAPIEKQHQQIIVQMAEAEERAKIRQTAVANRALVSRMESEAAEQKARYKTLTEALASLKKLRDSLLEKLPIKGLEFRGGEAFLKGVPVSELNTAAEAKFWIHVAAIRAEQRDCQVIAIDNGEHFDDKTLPAVIEGAKQSGMQFFITAVAPHDFKIETF